MICKGFIDRLHVNFNMLFITIYYIILYYIILFLFLNVFLDAARIGYTFWLSLSHEFEQFGSLHMCAHIYRLQRDSNPVSLGSASTTLPMNMK